jgi:hypothetical protein
MSVLDLQCNFTSLSLKELLEARDAYHAHLLSKANVIGTAVEFGSKLFYRSGRGVVLRLLLQLRQERGASAQAPVKLCKDGLLGVGQAGVSGCA